MQSAPLRTRRARDRPDPARYAGVDTTALTDAGSLTPAETLPGSASWRTRRCLTLVGSGTLIASRCRSALHYLREDGIQLCDLGGIQHIHEVLLNSADMHCAGPLQ